MSDGMEEIIDDFIVESSESLDKIDPLFVELETRGYDKDMLNDIFRSMHTIKGAAGFLGFQSLVEVAHKTENIMKRLRDGEMQVSRPIISIVLKSVDMLKLLLRHIKAKDGVEEDIAPHVRDLESALTGQLPRAQEAQSPAVTEPEAMPKADAQGAKTVERPAHAPAPQTTQAPQTEQAQTLRVDIDRIDKVMNLTGEIVLVRNRLLNLSNYLESKYSGDEHIDGLQETVSFLDLVTSDIQLAVMKMRMQPIKKVFGKFPRLVRDISQSLGKDVQLNISGEETEVDRSVIERIGDPMVHIIRNAIDHGLEPVEQRRSVGKPLKGVIDISAYQQGNQIIIEVKDDGRGIDIDKVKRKAVQKGLVTQDESDVMADKDALNMIFLPGFSTIEVATELSGRGVGMDVVKTNIAKLNGYVEILSEKNAGTTFKISIPLTLAIIQALMVRAGGIQYAIPLGPIEETIKISASEVKNVTGSKVLAIRDRVLPLVELSGILNMSAHQDMSIRYVLVIAIGEQKFCVSVDELLGQEEVVIKAIEGIDTESTGILGATITGDGKIVLILDPLAMSRSISPVSMR